MLQKKDDEQNSNELDSVVTDINNHKVLNNQTMDRERYMMFHLQIVQRIHQDPQVFNLIQRIIKRMAVLPSRRSICLV